MKKKKELSIKELIKKVDSNKIKVKSDEQVLNEEVEVRENLKAHISSLVMSEVVMLNDYFAGKAVITYKNAALAEEAVQEWIVRMGAKLCILCEKIMDNPNVKDKDKISVIKEIFLRVSPPKQEIVLVNKNKGKTDYTLLADANKTAVGIERSFKKLGVKDAS